MEYRDGTIWCSEDLDKNYVEFNDKLYKIEAFTKREQSRGGMGGNSKVFKLFDPDNEDEIFDIIKFCKYPLSTEDSGDIKRIERFKKEIRALKQARDADLTNIVHIMFNDAKTIDGQDFLYYAMERADSDLLDYFNSNIISDQQKLLLCLQVCAGIQQLHELGYYHRDIKPENVFFFESLWKIGDLGLIASRAEDQTLDAIKEKIGPTGWLSPEAVNKLLCEGTPQEVRHCCQIWDYSDVFQLGNLIWYVFEGTAPVGLVEDSDWQTTSKELYDLIRQMLQHSKDRRPKLNNVIDRLTALAPAFGA